MNQDFPIGLAARLTAYSLLVMALVQFVVLIGRAYGGHAFTLDNSPLEWFHFTLALLATFGFLAVGRLRVDLRAALNVLAAFSFIAAMREVDKFTEEFLFYRAYWIASAVAVTWALVRAWRQPDIFKEQVLRLANSPVVFLGWFAVVVIGIFAQILGQKELWQAVMESTDLPYRTAKNMAEEGCEVLGYIMLLCAAMESWWVPRRE